MKLYYRHETVQFKWLLLCRRCERDRPVYKNLPEGTNESFDRHYSYLTLYIRFPWKVWCYSINNDAPDRLHPMWCFSFRWVAQPPLRGHPNMRPNARIAR